MIVGIGLENLRPLNVDKLFSARSALHSAVIAKGTAHQRGIPEWLLARGCPTNRQAIAKFPFVTNLQV